MAELINLNVYPAHNIICVWNENNEDCSFERGIARDDAERGFMIPKYIVVGVFSDGTAKAAGIFGYNVINRTDSDDLFLYDEFLDFINIDAAKAFVRFEVSQGTEETDAKNIVLSILEKSGVGISEEAEMYLLKN
jgi:hypothetical protein